MANEDGLIIENSIHEQHFDEDRSMLDMNIDKNTYEPHFEDFDTAIQVFELHKRYRKYYRSKVILNGLNLKCYAGKLLD